MKILRERRSTTYARLGISAAVLLMALVRLIQSMDPWNLVAISGYSIGFGAGAVILAHIGLWRFDMNWRPLYHLLYAFGLSMTVAGCFAMDPMRFTLLMAGILAVLSPFFRGSGAR